MVVNYLSQKKVKSENPLIHHQTNTEVKSKGTNDYSD